jgi:hypothetical protein
VREDTTTLTLMDCTMEIAGYYECKAVSDLGLDKTRASLTVNSKSQNLTIFFLAFLNVRQQFYEEQVEFTILQ